MPPGPENDDFSRAISRTHFRVENLPEESYVLLLRHGKEINVAFPFPSPYPLPPVGEGTSNSYFFADPKQAASPSNFPSFTQHLLPFSQGGETDDSCAMLAQCTGIW